MMFGLGDIYDYFQCSVCKCLQISEMTKDLDFKYPPNYYSYNMQSSKAKHGRIGRFIRRKRNQSAVFKKKGIGKVINDIVPNKELAFLSEVAINNDTSILDVGCGDGKLLYELKEIGLDNILGIDPFINRDITYDNGLQIKKVDIGQTKCCWDIIMFNHSLEHILDPLEALLKAKDKLHETGVIIIRTPVADTFAWEKYGTEWVQIDAPRHVHVFSLKSLGILVNNVGMNIYDVIYDSTEFQFWGSEQYMRRVPLYSGDSYLVNPKNSFITRRQMGKFKSLSRLLNKEERGDQVIAYIRKP